jgi:hypothetical protein
MIFGCRFAHDAPDSAWRQAGATCELVAVNVYPRIDLFHQRTVGLEKHLRHCFTRCGKPLIVTEWGFPALDASDSRGRPLPSRHGAGMRVDTQQQKAACYAIMQRDLFRLPFVVGSHYFMWCDEPGLGISKSFPEDSNYGLVNESDKPYKLVTETAARVNAQLADLHAGRIRGEDIPPGTVVPVAPATAQPGEGELHFQRTVAGCTVETGPLRLVKDAAGGRLFDCIARRASARDAWTELGSFEAVLQTKTSAGNGWPHADRVTGVRALRQDPRRLVLEIECAGDAAPKWKAAYRLEFEPGRAWFRTRVAWVESADTRAWRLAAYYHYLTPHIGGDGRNEVPGPTAPNYWVAVATWRDPVLHLHYGAMPPQGDDRVECMFWRDAEHMPHPDCRRIIERRRG